MERSVTEERAENRDLPDIDFIGIFRLPPGITWSLEPSSWENQRQFFEAVLFNNPKWQEIALRLPSAFSNRTFPASTVVPGPNSDKAYRLKAFFEQLALPVSFTVHIPDVLWQNLDLLIHDNDWQRLDAIRDLLIGIEKPLAIK